MGAYLEAIGRTDLLATLTEDRNAWQLLVARKPYEKKSRSGTWAVPRDVWDQALGKGGMIGDLTDQDRSPIR
jgi:hypothetical protein